MTSGTSATRRSLGAVSLGTATFIQGPQALRWARSGKGRAATANGTGCCARGQPPASPGRGGGARVGRQREVFGLPVDLDHGREVMDEDPVARVRRRADEQLGVIEAIGRDECELDRGDETGV